MKRRLGKKEERAREMDRRSEKEKENGRKGVGRTKMGGRKSKKEGAMVKKINGGKGGIEGIGQEEEEGGKKRGGAA